MNYLEMLDSLENTHNTILCEYCGVETAAIGEICICSNCECFAHSSRSMLEKRDHVLLDNLDQINALSRTSDFDAAMKIYDQRYADQKDPFVIYAEALLCIQYSNHEISLISYDQSGFMEGNIKHRDKAARLISTSKKLLAKVISSIQAEIAKGSKSPNMVYLMFLSQLKLGKIKAADSSMKDLFQMENKYIAEYSAMLLNIALQKYDEAEKYAEKLVSKDNFSVNALFYIAYAKFKKKNTKEAIKIFARLPKFVKSQNVHAIMDEIRERQAPY